MTHPVTDATGRNVYEAEWRAWRAGWQQWLAQPHGWLAAVAVHWLDDTPRSYDGVPGRWWQSGETLMIDLDGATMTFEGAELAQVAALDLAEGPDDRRIAVGDLEIGITYRDGYHINVYDPAAPARAVFDGVPVHDPDPAWIVTGRFEAHDGERSLALDTVGWREHEYLSPGVVHFEHDGAAYRMQVIVAAGRYTTVFTDGTSGDTTYPAGRSLDVPAPAADGTVTLDFNRALNLPCAFADYFPICPTPPAGNRYPFRIEAGEKTPRK
ncbi:DUF1684 domain-containing protein, partial [Myceligenerans pegani]